MTAPAAPRHHFRPDWAIGQLPGEGGDDLAAWVIFYGPAGGE